MKHAGTTQKRVVAIAEDMDFLHRLEQEILRCYPNCRVDMVTTVANECKLKGLAPDDLIVWDITETTFANTVGAAVGREQPVLILENHPGSAESLKRVEEFNVLRYMETADLSEVVHMIHDFFSTTSPWRRGSRRVRDRFNRLFRSLVPKEPYHVSTEDKLFYY